MKKGENFKLLFDDLWMSKIFSSVEGNLECGRK